MPEVESQRRTLARRLLLAVVLPVALLTAVALVLGAQISAMSDSAKRVEHSNAVIIKVNELLSRILDQETGVRGFLLSGEPAFLEPYQTARPLEALRELDGLVADNAEQLQRVTRVRERYLDWYRSTEGIQTATPELQAELRSPRILRDRRARMDGVRAALDDVRTVEEHLLSERAEASARSTRTLVGTGIPLLAILALALVYGSRRQIGGVAETFGNALAKERDHRETLELRNWVRNRQVKVGDSIQGDLTIEQIGGTVLEQLVDATGAQVGAFYVIDAQVLVRRAAFALDLLGRERFAVGEGLAGRVAQDKKSLFLSDVPDDYLKIASGTGETGPAEVAIVPACVDGGCHAIVELGFLKPINTRSKELLQQIGETVGHAVITAKQKAQLRELLEESIQQAEELEVQQEELRAINDSLANQRDALAETQSELQKKAQELSRTSRYKSEFLANMSHELRTPLNSTLILAKLLSDNASENLTPEQVKFARTIYDSSNNLLVLIGDILDLAKVEAGKLNLSVAATTVGHLVESVVATFDPIAQQKGVTFSAQISNETDEIVTDTQRVRQILVNLLSNAFKFTERGSVSLQIATEGERFRFAVRDDGIGIAPEEQESIFDAFHQADGTMNRKYGGTGLGLSISRDLARLLGGDIEVESERGKGSVFTLTLPRDGAKALGVPRTTPRLTSSSKARVTGPTRSASQRPQPAFADDRGQLDSSKRSLLIVEADVDLASEIAAAAREAGWQIVVAHTADEGTRLAFECLPTAVILDAMLPDHAGLAVLDRIKTSAETRHIAVHVLGANGEARGAAIAMGAMGHSRKGKVRDEMGKILAGLAAHATRQRQVLIVEDDPAQQDAIVRLLSIDGAEISSTATIADALKALREKTFDCVVLDLSLSDGTGFDLLEAMAKEETPAPPFIVYTARMLTPEEELRLGKHSRSIILKGARSPERLLDEVLLYLHQADSEVPTARRKLLLAARSPDPILGGKKILLAEDDVRNVFALTSIFEPLGIELSVARNGRVALEMLTAHPEIDLVLMDVMMPEMDGFEAMRRIRERGGAWASLPIIALTAKAMADDREKCLAAGANEYVAKPIDVDLLLSLMRVWLSSARGQA